MTALIFGCCRSSPHRRAPAGSRRAVGSKGVAPGNDDVVVAGAAQHFSSALERACRVCPTMGKRSGWRTPRSSRR